MDDITSRAIVIAVNVFVTIAIVSIIIMMFFQMQEIYGIVYNTDTSIYSIFDNVYAMYEGRTMTGLGLLNTIKKYENNTEGIVLITYPGGIDVKKYASDNNIREAVHLKSLMEAGTYYKYEKKYKVTVINSGVEEVTINFYEI